MPAQLEEKKRVVRKHFKTRTGCATCRSRRIKCDEMRPICVRCSKAGRVCRYIPVKTWIFDSKSPPDTPSSSAENDAIDVGILPTTETVPVLLPSFGTGEESAALQFFVHKVAGMLSSFSTPYFWNIIIPQVSWEDPAVKHALVAMSMLNRSLKDLRGMRVPPHHPCIAHYNKAISYLTRPEVPPSVEIVLLSCILFYVFDNQHGAGDVALMHLKSGLKILNEWKAKNSGSNTIIERYISPTLLQGESYAGVCVQEPINSIDPNHINDKTFLSKVTEPTLQSYFFNLTEATIFLARCSRWLLLAQAQEEGDEHYCAIDHVFRFMRHFEELYKAYTGPGWPSDKDMLQLHYLTIKILLETWYAKSEMEYDIYLNEFRMILDSMKRLLEMTKIQSSLLFTHDLGLIPPLFLIATKCRNVDIRHKAKILLRDLHRTEGAWNSDLAALVAGGIIRLEKRTIFGGAKQITEANRIREVMVDCDGGRLCMYYKRQHVTKEKEVAWTDEMEVLASWSKAMDRKIELPLKTILRSCGYQMPF